MRQPGDTMYEVLRETLEGLAEVEGWQQGS